MAKYAPKHPEEDLRQIEIYSYVLNTLKSLKRDKKEIFILCVIDELTYREAAEYMMVSTSTVYRRLHRAKVTLRKKLARIN